jgi:NAD-dependent deacetylase
MGHRIEEVASPQGFRKNPKLVLDFYNQRRQQLLSPEVVPNAAHLSLAQWEASFAPGDFTLVTQNIDDLHQRAGSLHVLPMHGELLKARRTDTDEAVTWREDITLDSEIPGEPTSRGRLRPHIVWFGEMPFFLEEIGHAVRNCDCFVAIGTSGTVYPAAGLVRMTPDHCWKVEINVEGSEVSAAFDDFFTGPATEEVPRFIAEYLRMQTEGPRVTVVKDQ